MRYIRTILDVMCYHDKTNVSSTSSQISISSPFIFDIARLKNDELIYKEENISDEARLYFDNNRSKLQRIANGVVRFYLPSGSYSGFYMGLNLIGTNEHNISQMKLSSSFSKTNDIYSTMPLLKQCTTVTNNDFDFVYARNNIISLNIVETTLFDPNKYSNIRERHIEQDPILGITGNFDMIDFVVVKETQKVRTNNSILFIPSTQHVQINDPIITISHPGNELSTQESSGRHHYDLFLPQFEELRKIFHGFGGRCISYGRVIAPYKLNSSSNKWIEDLQYRNTDFSNYQCILSNENLYHGSSAGVTLKSNFDIYENIPTANGQQLTLVEFISIHFGGEFIPCQDCLCDVIPSNREQIGPDNIQFLHECKSCNDHKQTPVSYNYGVSVHHPAFQKYYHQQKEYYLNLFGGNLPKPLNDYYELHHI
ncbi:unnamed protein product [Rotaria sordida]|uniref:Uncharacterized protein n=1 Tax=Rotaria sordida TaxID=392033 RepID=A0A814K574_9BILA|nr:unnamed protein product [Rotaria sordida]